MIRKEKRLTGDKRAELIENVDIYKICHTEALIIKFNPKEECKNNVLKYLRRSRNL